MSRTTFWTPVLALSWLATSCAPSPKSAVTPAHAAAMRDSVGTMLEAFRRHSAAAQWDSLSALYDDDAGFRWVEQGTVRYRSPADIRNAFAELPAGGHVETTLHDTEISALAPGVAWVVSGFDTRFVDPAGRGFAFSGSITMTLVHRPAGWRIAGGHASSPPSRPQ